MLCFFKWHTCPGSDQEEVGGGGRHARTDSDKDGMNGSQDNQSISCTRSELLPAYLLLPCRVLPYVSCPIFPSCAWNLHAALHIFLASSCFCYSFRISHTDTCLLWHTNPPDVSFPPFFLSMKIHFSFDLGLRSWLHTARLRTPLLAPV